MADGTLPHACTPVDHDALMADASLEPFRVEIELAVARLTGNAFKLSGGKANPAELRKSVARYLRIRFGEG